MSAKYYEVIGPVVTYHEKFGIRRHSFQIRWIDIIDCPNYDETVTAAITEVYNEEFKDSDPTDRVQFEIDHPKLIHPVSRPFTAPSKISARFLCNLIEEKIGRQLRHNLEIKFTRVRFPEEYRRSHIMRT